MKLNNHGWGLNEMLIYCGILLFFLIVAIFFIIQLSNSLGDALKDNVSYTMVEENIEEATASYMELYYKEDVGTGTITVTTDNLIKYNLLNLSSLKPTEENESCKGYALVKNQNDALVITPYIKCDNYESNGYQSWRLGE